MYEPKKCSIFWVQYIGTAFTKCKKMSNIAMKNALQTEKNVLLCYRKLTSKKLIQKIFSKKLFLTIFIKSRKFNSKGE